MGSEQINKRRQNQYEILRALHFNGAMRRSRIGNEHGIRKSSITSIVTELLGVGIIRESVPGSTRSPIQLDHARYYALATSITPRFIRFVRCYLDGHLADNHVLPLSGDTTPDEVLGMLTDEIKRMLSVDQGECLGVGVAIQGIVDPATGMTLHAARLDRWRHVEVGRRLRQATGRDVLVDNDVRCQLWACSWFDRLARDSENTLYVHVHDGVACAIMTHGRRIVGEHSAAGEIGHLCVGDEGRACICGRLDCLEAYCSIPAIADAVSRVRPTMVIESARDIVEAAETDSVARGVLDQAARRLARALSGVVAVVDPRTLVLGTPDPDFSKMLHGFLEKHLYTELIGRQPEAADIVIAQDVETGAIKGIAGMVIDHAFAEGRFSWAGNETAEA